MYVCCWRFIFFLLSHLVWNYLYMTLVHIVVVNKKINLLFVVNYFIRLLFFFLFCCCCLLNSHTITHSLKLSSGFYNSYNKRKKNEFFPSPCSIHCLLCVASSKLSLYTQILNKFNNEHFRLLSSRVCLFFLSLLLLLVSFKRNWKTLSWDPVNLVLYMCQWVHRLRQPKCQNIYVNYLFVHLRKFHTV